MDGCWFSDRRRPDLPRNDRCYDAYLWGSSGDIPAPGDFDGDGKADITVYRPSSGEWYILKSSTNFTGYSVYQWGVSTDVPVLKRY